MSKLVHVKKIEKVDLVKVIARKDDKFPPALNGEFAFVGRSNVGKSSLLNALVGKRIAFVSKNPGKTRTINYYEIDNKFYFVDLPGYGYARTSKADRETWKKVIEMYFTERNWNMRALFSLVDSRHELMESDSQLLEWTHILGLKPIVILTKLDKLSSSERKKQIDYFNKELKLYSIEEIIPCSSLTKEGLDRVWNVIFEKLNTDK